MNTFEELIGSGLKVYTYNDSWVWWQFKGSEMKWGKLDEKLSKIQNRMDYLTREKFNDQVIFDYFLLPGSYCIVYYSVRKKLGLLYFLLLENG